MRVGTGNNTFIDCNAVQLLTQGDKSFACQLYYVTQSLALSVLHAARTFSELQLSIDLHLQTAGRIVGSQVYRLEGFLVCGPCSDDTIICK